MAGLRIINPLLSQQTDASLVGLKVLVDHDTFSAAKAMNVLLLGNAIVQGKVNIAGTWGSVSAASTILRVSTDQGANWSPDITVPTGAGIVALLSNLAGADRLSATVLKDMEGFTNPTEYEHITFDTTYVNGADATVGKLYWDIDNQTLSLNLYEHPTDARYNVILQIGQELLTRVKNDTASTINNGSAVFVSGSTTVVPQVELANAAAGATAHFLGLATTQIPASSFGYVVTYGVINDVNTSTFLAGDVLYVSTTDGVLTKTIPAEPNYVVRVGIVLTVHATAGKIFISSGLDYTNKVVVNALSALGDLRTKDIITTTTNYHYWGEKATDGSWRMGLSGTSFVIERREAGSWVTKTTITS